MVVISNINLIMIMESKHFSYKIIFEIPKAILTYQIFIHSFNIFKCEIIVGRSFSTVLNDTGHIIYFDLQSF